MLNYIYMLNMVYTYGLLFNIMKKKSQTYYWCIFKVHNIISSLFIPKEIIMFNPLLCL